MTAGGLVYAAMAGVTARTKEKKKAEPSAAMAPATAARLPQQVEDMIDLLRSAIRSGDIEELRAALQWNELPPVVADGVVTDPIAHWRQLSADGAGRDVLAVLSLLLDGEPAIVPLGRDLENNRLYVWPAIAERPIARLSPAEQVQLLRLVPFADAKRMADTGRYDGWRLVIGADGTWHSFRRG